MRLKCVLKTFKETSIGTMSKSGKVKSADTPRNVYVTIKVKARRHDTTRLLGSHIDFTVVDEVSFKFVTPFLIA